MNLEERRAAGRSLGGTLINRISGGCDDCTAYADLIDHGDGIYRLVICHDDTCPTWRSIQNARNA